MITLLKAPCAGRPISSVSDMATRPSTAAGSRLAAALVVAVSMASALAVGAPAIAAQSPQAAGPAIPIQLRTRGHVRRSPRLCGFAPLRLEFRKRDVKGTAFQGQTAVKLGTHCQGDGVYRQYTLTEYLASRLYSVLTPRSFRSRLAQVTYADTAPGKAPFTKLGIFFEDGGDLARRTEGREDRRQGLMFRHVDQPTLTLLSLFQYLSLIHI